MLYCTIFAYQAYKDNLCVESDRRVHDDEAPELYQYIYVRMIMNLYHFL